MANHKWTEETDAIDRATKRALEIIGKVVLGRAQAYAHGNVDTGRLAGSLTYAVKNKQSDITRPGPGPHATDRDRVKKPQSKYELYVGSNVEYAQHVEYGTRYTGSGWPYLRPALDDSRRDAQKIYRDELKAAFRGK